MKPKHHAEVWEAVTQKAYDACKTMAGDRAAQMQVLALFAGMVAEAYRESDNARG